MIDGARLAALAVALLSSLAGMHGCRQEEPASEPMPPVHSVASDVKANNETMPALTSGSGGEPTAVAPTSPTTSSSRPVPAQESATAQSVTAQPAALRVSARGADESARSFVRPMGGPVASLHFVPRRSIDAAEKELVVQWDRLRSLTAKITTSLVYKDEQDGKHDGAGTLDCMKKDGKLYMNMRVYNSILIERPGEQWILTGLRLTKMSDGDVVFTVEQRHDTTTVTKARAIPPHIRAVGGVDLFVRMHRSGRVRLLADEKIDGREVYVFEVHVKGGAVVTRHRVDKETGVRLHFEMERLDGTSTFTFALSELEIDPEFSEDHFTFVPPDDVEIQDLTQGGSRATPGADGR